MKQFRKALWVASAMVVGAGATMAQDKSQYSLSNPTPDSQLRDMSTDRPDATESPYTVDAGRFQLELDLLGYTYDRSDGTTTRGFDVVPFNLKVGLTHRTDLQLVYDAYSHTRESAGGVRATDTGFGDFTVRLKHNIWGNDSGKTALAVMPFVKIPTNTLSGLNNEVEGGVIVPMAIALAEGVDLGLQTEVDFVSVDDGHDLSFINSAALGLALTERWGMFVEAFVEHSLEDDADTIVTLNGGLTYAVNANLQLDAGANIGVTDAADDLKIFVGLSRRY